MLTWLGRDPVRTFEWPVSTKIILNFGPVTCFRRSPGVCANFVNRVTAERWAFCIGKRRLCHGRGLIVDFPRSSSGSVANIASAQRDVATALCRRAGANAMNASTQRGGYSVTKSSAEHLRGSLGLAISKKLSRDATNSRRSRADRAAPGDILYSSRWLRASH
jgi:hypothetical protein